MKEQAPPREALRTLLTRLDELCASAVDVSRHVKTAARTERDNKVEAWAVLGASEGAAGIPVPAGAFDVHVGNAAASAALASESATGMDVAVQCSECAPASSALFEAEHALQRLLSLDRRLNEIGLALRALARTRERLPALAAWCLRTEACIQDHAREKYGVDILPRSGLGSGPLV